jgi:hypothetical protein
MGLKEWKNDYKQVNVNIFVQSSGYMKSSLKTHFTLPLRDDRNREVVWEVIEGKTP